MKKVRFTLSIGFACGEHEEIMEYEDDATDKEIDEDWSDWAWNYIDGGAETIDNEEEE